MIKLIKVVRVAAYQLIALWRRPMIGVIIAASRGITINSAGKCLIMVLVQLQYLIFLDGSVFAVY